VGAVPTALVLGVLLAETACLRDVTAPSNIRLMIDPDPLLSVITNRRRGG